jgi:Domain of unknown function (DUF4372)
MNLGRTVFAQLLDFIPKYSFQICVDRYQGNRYVKEFSCWDQFLCLAFAQLTYRESLRDIEACLRTQQPKLYHMGFRGRVSRHTLAHANEVRNWRVYADFAQVLIGIARDLYRDEPFGVEYAKPFTCSTRPASIWVCPCFHGLSFVITGAPSNCIRRWTCGAAFRPMFM